MTNPHQTSQRPMIHQVLHVSLRKDFLCQPQRRPQGKHSPRERKIWIIELLLGQGLASLTMRWTAILCVSQGKSSTKEKGKGVEERHCWSTMTRGVHRRSCLVLFGLLWECFDWNEELWQLCCLGSPQTMAHLNIQIVAVNYQCHYVNCLSFFTIIIFALCKKNSFQT